MQNKSAHLRWTGKEPIRSPAERVRFGEEEQRSEREMIFNAKHKKSSQAIQSLRRRGDPYRTPRLRASRVAALTCPRHVIHCRSLRVPREICKINQPTFGGLARSQIEAQQSGFDLERRSKGAQTKNPATLKELPDFERSGLCSDVVTRTGLLACGRAGSRL